MAKNLLSCDFIDDDYIDMEVSSYSIFHCNSITSSQQEHHHHNRDFEFQMSSATTDDKETTSPADELFYKGKLLPLHLPPRLQMVEKLLENSNPSYVIGSDTLGETYGTPLATTAPTPTAPSTPYESCKVSPAQSFRISRQMNLGEYLDEYSNRMSYYSCENPKKSWSGKMKVIKQTLLGPGLKSSRTYLKSFFGKSGCSQDSCAIAAESNKKRPVSNPKGSSSSEIDKAAKQNQGNKSDGDSKQKKKTSKDGSNCQHRRSLSASIKRHSNKISSSSSSSSSNSSSSSCSNDSNGSSDMQFMKRSIVSADTESPIQGAIAYCKKSQNLFQTRNSVNDGDEYCSRSASQVSMIEDQEKLKHLSRG